MKLVYLLIFSFLSVLWTKEKHFSIYFLTFHLRDPSSTKILVILLISHLVVYNRSPLEIMDLLYAKKFLFYADLRGKSQSQVKSSQSHDFDFVLQKK